MFSSELCSGETLHPVMSELFGGEVFWSPFVDVVYCAVIKVFVFVDFHCVQWVVSGVLWFGEVLGDGC